MENTNHESSIAVLWCDGSQECKILNVSPRAYNDDTILDVPSPCLDDKLYDVHKDFASSEIVSRGIDNAGYVNNPLTRESAGDINEQSSTSSCSSRSGDSHILSLERRPSTKVITRSSTHASTQGTSSNISDNAQYSHNNPAFEMPQEASYDAVVSGSTNPTVVKGSPIHPNVYLLRNQTSEGSRLTLCTCPSNDVIIQVRPSKEVSDEVNIVMSNESENSNDTKIHFIKRGIASPDKSQTICDAHSIDTLSSNTKGDGDSLCGESPPHYNSLRFMFLEDEPPKYQDVTGKKLAMGDIPKVQRATSAKWKRRAIVFAVILFIVLIGALLVYACFVSGHPLGAYGTVPRKF